MTLPPPRLFLGELFATPLGDFRILASDLGLVALEWADNQPELDAYLKKIKRVPEPNQRRAAPYAKELKEYLTA